MNKIKEQVPSTCKCGNRLNEQHVRFFVVHEAGGGEVLCAECFHRERAKGLPDVTLPAWVVDEIVCLLSRADGLSDLVRRTSKEIGCECQKEVRDPRTGAVLDVTDLCVYHHARDVDDRAGDVLRWIEKAIALGGVKEVTP